MTLLLEGRSHCPGRCAALESEVDLQRRPECSRLRTGLGGVMWSCGRCHVYTSFYAPSNKGQAKDKARTSNMTLVAWVARDALGISFRGLWILRCDRVGVYK